MFALRAHPLTWTRTGPSLTRFRADVNSTDAMEISWTGRIWSMTLCLNKGETRIPLRNYPTLDVAKRAAQSHMHDRRLS